MQGTPLPRPDVEDLISKNVFTNKSGKIDGDLLAKILQYIQASAPNILTDGLLGGPGGPTPDYLAVLRALQLKADQSFVVNELGKKEPKFTGLLAQDLQPGKAGFAGLLLYQLLVKIVNESGSGGLSATALALSDAQAEIPANKVEEGGFYAITGPGWNKGGATSNATVYTFGLTPTAYAPTGWVLDAYDAWREVTVDVVAGTFDTKPIRDLQLFQASDVDAQGKVELWLGDAATPDAVIKEVLL